MEESEHSLEMHAPFIRKVFQDVKIKLVPLMVGHLSPENISKCGEILAKYFVDSKTLFVVSSDFCHWGKRFEFTHRFEEGTPIYKSIEKLDHMGMSLIEEHDLKGFQQYLHKYKNTICGSNPI